MTNLKPVTEGFNKFCGPAVLSILTGKSTDECARVISRINGQYNVTGVMLNDLLRALDKLGFDQRTVDVASGCSLYKTFISLAPNDGMYVVMIKGHYVCVEVKEKKIYLCDNHTKEPIPAGSSARLSMQVLTVVKVIERQKLPEPPKPILINSQINTFIYKEEYGTFTVTVKRDKEYTRPECNTSEIIATFTLRSIEEMKQFTHGFIARLNIIKDDGV